jgi:hypothetical protein
MFKKPIVRLAARALLAGLAVLVVGLEQAPAWDTETLRALLVAAGFAALEVFTPLNSLVGAFKKG